MLPTVAQRFLLVSAITTTPFKLAQGLSLTTLPKSSLLHSTFTTTTTTSSRSMTSTNSENPKKLFLFDFDGVVCDSCDECTVSALRTCHKLGVLDYPETYPPSWLFERMRAVRPAIYVGWQIPVLLSAIVEQQHQTAENSSSSGEENKKMMTDEEIVTNYETIVSTQLSKWNKSDQDMIDTFGEVRDDWIANDLTSWLDINAFYTGVPDALRNCNGESVLVTTKQHRFATALVRHAGVEESAMPDDDIYGLGMYKGKADVIVDRMSKGGFEADNVYFFEDRWPTLAKCLKDERLEGVNLHLCSWGYVTKEEREMAEKEPRVKVLSLEEFSDIVTS